MIAAAHSRVRGFESELVDPLVVGGARSAFVTPLFGVRFRLVVAR